MTNLSRRVKLVASRIRSTSPEALSSVKHGIPVAARTIVNDVAWSWDEGRAPMNHPFLPDRDGPHPNGIGPGSAAIDESAVPRVLYSGTAATCLPPISTSDLATPPIALRTEDLAAPGDSSTSVARERRDAPGRSGRPGVTGPR